MFKTWPSWFWWPSWFCEQMAKRSAVRAAGSGAGGGSTPSSEDDGYLLGFAWDGDAQKSKVVVRDATNISAGPICRITLPHYLAAARAEWLARDLGERWALGTWVVTRFLSTYRLMALAGSAPH